MAGQLKTIPLTRRVAVVSNSSQMRQASGRSVRRLAESSRVRSSKECAALCQAVFGIPDNRRASESIFSAWMGLRLKGMADEPTGLRPNGSDHSPNGGDCIIRKYKANLYRLGPMTARGLTTR